MNLIKAIETAGIQKRLRKFATRSVLNTELMTWLHAQAELQNLTIEWPSISGLRYVRAHYQCGGGRGGPRPCGQQLYNVAHRKNRALAPLSI